MVALASLCLSADYRSQDILHVRYFRLAKGRPFNQLVLLISFRACLLKSKGVISSNKFRSNFSSMSYSKEGANRLLSCQSRITIQFATSENSSSSSFTSSSHTFSSYISLKNSKFLKTKVNDNQDYLSMSDICWPLLSNHCFFFKNLMS